MNGQFIAVEGRRAEQAPNPDSLDLYFQGLVWLAKGQVPEHLAKARNFFDRALAADPGNIDALIGSAVVDAIEGANSAANPLASFTAAESKLTKALSVVPDHPIGHTWLGLVEIWTKRASQGVARCEHALELNRNLALAHFLIGYGKLFLGRPEETEPHIAEALRLSPRDAGAYAWLFTVGVAKLALSSNEQAVAWFRRSIDANRNFPHAHFFQASALAQLDRLDDARAAVNAGLGLNPAYTITRDRALWTWVSNDPNFWTSSISPLMVCAERARRNDRCPAPKTRPGSRMSAPGATVAFRQRPQSDPSVSLVVPGGRMRTI